MVVGGGLQEAGKETKAAIGRGIVARAVDVAPIEYCIVNLL